MRTPSNDFPLIFPSSFLHADTSNYQYRCNYIISPELCGVLLVEPPDRPPALLPYVTNSRIPSYQFSIISGPQGSLSLLSPYFLIIAARSPPRLHGHGNHHPAFFHGWPCWLNSLRPEPPFTSRTSTPPHPNLDLHPEPLALPHLRQLSSAPGPGSGWRQQLRRLSP